MAREHAGTAALGLSLIATPVWRGSGPAEVKVQGVLLVPGFGASDITLSVLRTSLGARRCRHRPRS
ncbi:hypothetical protein ACFWNN_02170 [Lentzea sp. NPDC058450]|uniref:hypothetical protein n=1 Tax=Lentzea sp. NPDC058450 TaxID=3346505 RepID=UPI00364C26CE